MGLIAGYFFFQETDIQRQEFTVIGTGQGNHLEFSGLLRLSNKGTNKFHKLRIAEKRFSVPVEAILKCMLISS